MKVHNKSELENEKAPSQYLTPLVNKKTRQTQVPNEGIVSTRIP